MRIARSKRSCIAASTIFVVSLVACQTPTPLTVDANPLATLCPEAFANNQAAYWICSIGNRQEMLASGDLRGRVRLDKLPGLPNLIGVGPLQGLQGEITIDQGVVILSTIEDDAQVVTHSGNGEAVFLAFGAARAWQDIAISRPLAGFDAIEGFIAEAAAERGIDPETAFPFRILGAASVLDYHVIFKTGDGHHGPHAHHKAKVPFTASGEQARIVGVWADAASIGVYTHEGRRTHMHVVLQDHSGAGHVDALTVPAGMTLQLPLVE